MKIKEFILARAFTLMIFGMAMAVAGVFSSMVFVDTPRYVGTIYPILTNIVAVLGFVMYFVGRIALSISRKQQAHQRTLSRRDDFDDDVVEEKTFEVKLDNVKSDDIKNDDVNVDNANSNIISEEKQIVN